MGDRFANDPKWDVNVIVTGNQAGFQEHFPQWDKQFMENLLKDLQQAITATPQDAEMDYRWMWRKANSAAITIFINIALIY
jgi:hypothetical protein